MKKFMNSTETMLHQSLSGFAQCHRDIVALDREFRFVSRKQAKRGKVALISGGGSGHEPLHAGFVGYGMLDAACPGQIFTSPTPDQMVAAAEAVETGAGILFIVKNYAGDVMNFALAAEMCHARADTLVSSINAISGYRAERLDGASTIGGGSAPGAELPTHLIAVDRSGLSPDALEERLRATTPPVIGRIERLEYWDGEA